MERCELPDGWVWRKIGEVADTTSGGTPSRARPEFYNGTIPWLKSGELEDNYISDTEEKITESGLKNSSAKIFPKGTGLVALYGATVGKTGILKIDAATNQAVCAIFPRCNFFTVEYMAYWLRSQRQELVELSTGGAQPNISQGIIREFDIPLAPLPEQQRIVAKIESLFEQLSTARESLARIPQLMAQFRRAVLASAFRGGLVEHDPNDEPAAALLERVRTERRRKWEEDLRAKGKDPTCYTYHEPEPPDTSELPELPEGWVWAKIGEVADTTSGGTPSRTRPEFYNGMIPWLKSGELEDNYISDTEEKISESGLKNSSAKVFPKGTALVALYGATVGKTGILQIDAATNQAICAIFPRDNSFITEYMVYWLRSQRQALIELSTGGAQPNISQGIIRDFDIPLAPLPEQLRIVAKIESLFAQAEIIEQAASLSLRRAGQIDQSILARAFRGELR